jgi:predicted GNAT family N-acyltransferase
MSGPPEIRPVTCHREWLDALQVRREVFVHEQDGPPEDEPDAWDDAARHFIVHADGSVVGTARLYQPERGVGRVGRVALLPECRGRGWGALLLQAVLDHARALGFREVRLHAQSYACPFYERFGFVPVGQEFMEAGIPHREMRLILAARPR